MKTQNLTRCFPVNGEPGLTADFSQKIWDDLLLVLLSSTITRENANTYANKAPADIAVLSTEPVVTLLA